MIGTYVKPTLPEYSRTVRLEWGNIGTLREADPTDTIVLISELREADRARRGNEVWRLCHRPEYLWTRS